MDLKKYEHIAHIFGKYNAGEKVDDELEVTPETDKLKYIWDNFQPEDFDEFSIIESARQKIKYDAKKRKKRYWLTSCSVAASLLIFVFGFHFLSLKETTVSGLQAVITEINDLATVNEVTLVTPEKQLNLDEGSVISYTSEGKIAVNSNEIQEVNNAAKAKGSKQEYNQLLVPAGKRAYIELADGTHLAVNALSKVVYPRQFAKDKREIYIEGEVFLNVAHDGKRPFVVTTDDFDLQVLGTQFNITNYKSLGASNVVLVEGAVEVTDKNKKKATLRPNDLLSIKEGSITGQKQVNVSRYISWVDGLLILNGENVSHIVGKLQIYYGSEIQISSQIADDKIYGKLDLKDNLSEVLESVRQMLLAERPRSDKEIWLREVSN